jgi:hypothetical protein
MSFINDCSVYLEKQIQDKFDNLRSTFLKVNKKGKTGDGAKPKDPWPYFESMAFLRKASGQRKSYSNFSQVIYDSVNYS